MKKPRPLLTVSYRVLDGAEHCIDVITLTGPNKQYLKWKAERILKKKHGKGFKLHQYKIVKND